MFYKYHIRYTDNDGKERVMVISRHAEKRLAERFSLMHPNYHGEPNILRVIRRMFLKNMNNVSDGKNGAKYINCGEYQLVVKNNTILTIVINVRKYFHLNAA